MGDSVIALLGILGGLLIASVALNVLLFRAFREVLAQLEASDDQLVRDVSAQFQRARERSASERKPN